MLQLLQPTLPHNLEDLFVPALLVLDLREVRVLFSALDLVLSLLLMRLLVEPSHRLRGGLRSCEVVLDVHLRLL